MGISGPAVPAWLLGLAALTSMTAACQRHTPPAPSAAAAPTFKAAAITEERLAAGEPDQWLAQGRDANGTFYSPLRDIDTGNVAKLGLRLGLPPGHEPRPGVDAAGDRRRDVRHQQFRAGVCARCNLAARSSGNTTRTSTARGRATPVATPSIEASRRSTAEYSSRARRLAACGERAHRRVGVEGRYRWSGAPSTAPLR
jgi:hypothetical protein